MHRWVWSLDVKAPPLEHKANSNGWLLSFKQIDTQVRKGVFWNEAHFKYSGSPCHWIVWIPLWREFEEIKPLFIQATQTIGRLSSKSNCTHVRYWLKTPRGTNRRPSMCLKSAQAERGFLRGEGHICPFPLKCCFFGTSIKFNLCLWGFCLWQNLSVWR